MDKKLITYAIPVIIGLILLGGILYFISFFGGGDDKMAASLDEFKGKTEIFSSKKEAYDAYIRDSVVKVRDENVSVSLNDLFTGRKEETQELIPENQGSGQNTNVVETKAKDPVKQTPRKGNILHPMEWLPGSGNQSLLPLQPRSIPQRRSRRKNRSAGNPLTPSPRRSSRKDRAVKLLLSGR
ncbi:MAG: hypothetical protein HC831_04060 [Chloroflexia bacterium]|nr:hypothetical protein [Chloroflexia bacterium]